jgi:serine/threonine protein kinase
MSLVVADFGWAMLKDDAGYFNTPHCVTWPYRPPEIELLCEPYTMSCDVWSLGVVARELFTGMRIRDLENYNGRNKLTTLEQCSLAAEVTSFPTKLMSSRLFRQ